MQNLSDIKNRIRSISQTKQITKAMEMISVAKMRKANLRFRNNLLYFKKVRSTIKDILLHTKDITHPFLRHRDGNSTVYIVVAGDKGLAGGYNHEVLDFAWRKMQNVEKKYIFTVGQMASEFFEQKKQPIDVEFTHGTVEPTLYDARCMAADIIEDYKKGLMDEVVVIFTKMNNTVSHTPVAIKLLPVELCDFEDVETDVMYGGEIIYDPSPNAVLNVLIPEYIVGLIYGIIVQSSACEHSARMLAMENATKNAGEILTTLNQNFNRARQAKITSEIAEIVSASSLLI